MKNKIYFGRGEGVPAISAGMKKIVRDVIKKTLENENFAYGAEISVTFVLDPEIHRMNLEYRGGARRYRHFTRDGRTAGEGIRAQPRAGDRFSHGTFHAASARL